MRRKLAIFGAAMVIPIVGFVLGTASPAAADSNWAYCFYDESGNYLGAKSKATGALYTPAQITAQGCETDI